MFLSFPHISVDAMGTLGAISRPGRPGQSCACGALNAALADIKATGLKANCRKPGGDKPSSRTPPDAFTWALILNSMWPWMQSPDTGDTSCTGERALPTHAGRRYSHTGNAQTV